jgi:hypothetical protein
MSKLESIFEEVADVKNQQQLPKNAKMSKSEANFKKGIGLVSIGGESRKYELRCFFLL